MPPNIAIVGAGIAGLACARALALGGARVTVLEQSEELGEIGAGLSIWENGLLALEAIGLREAFENVSQPWKVFTISPPGKKTRAIQTRGFSADNDYDARIAHRGRLFSVLRDGLPDKVTVVTGFCVSDVEENADGVIVRADDGREFRGDVAIGADGTDSLIARRVTPRPKKFCNQICFRSVVPKQAPEGPFSGGEIFNAENLRFGYFPSAENETYWFALINSKQKTGDWSVWRQPLQDLHPHARKLLSGDKTPLCHPVYESTPVWRLRSKRIVLIGDAAHCIQPSLGQGAGLALEDGVVLARMLLHKPNAIDGVFEAFVKQRRIRWRLFYSLSRRMGIGLHERGIWGRRLALWQQHSMPEFYVRFIGRYLFSGRMKKERDLYRQVVDKCDG